MKHDWEYKKIGDICIPKKNIQKASNCFDANDEILYIDISSIDNKSQCLNSVTNYIMSEAPSRAQQCVKSGDIIISTVRPNLKNIAIVNKNDNNLVASSGFCVLRPNNIERNYLFHYITSDKFTNHLMSLTNGANYPAVRDNDILESTIPLPPLPTQQSIVSELDSLSKIIADCKETLKDYDALEQSIFYDMFGDPVKNEKGWEVKKLEEVAFVQNGLVSPTEEPYCEMIHVGPANIVSGTGELINLKTAKDENLISGKYLFDKDMILYSKIRPNLNKLTIAKFQGLCSADMYPIICGELLNPYYLASVLRHKRFLSYAIENSGRANIPKINREALFQFEMHLPPLPLQQQFASKIEAIEQMKVETKKALQEAETLFQARMDYWFN